MSNAPRTLSALLVALLLAALLNAVSLVAAAERLELGKRRTVALAFAQPALHISKQLGFDQARLLGDRWIVPFFRGSDSSEDVGASGESEPSSGPEAAPPAGAEDGRLSLASSEPCVPPEPAFPSPSQPLEVWYIGDSMLQYIEPSLRTELSQGELFEHDFDWRYSTGLSRPDYFDWPGRMEKRLSEAQPGAIVVMLGGNDGQSIAVEGRVLRTGTEAWREEYTARAVQLGEILSSRGAEVFWLGLPIMRSKGMRSRAEVMNSAYQAAAAESESIHFVETWGMFSDDQGRYSTYLVDPGGTRRRARGNDGIHLSRGGTRMLARALGSSFETEWDFEAWKLPVPVDPCGSMN